MPVDEGPPPYEVLAALVISLRQELTDARAEVAAARKRIAELEARLRQGPRNSSKPPSSEGLAKPAPRSLRKKSGRRPGGQDGHKGTTLAQVPRPDREVRHEPGCCSRCGAGLAGRPVTGVERRQVFDLPPARAEVTEHQLCCAHAQRELQAVADAAPAGEWCWATQAAEALTAMQDLVREAISQDCDAVDPEALAAQTRLFRSAVLAGAAKTAARSGPLMKKHNALARRLRDRQDDYLRFADLRAPPDNNGSERDIRMVELRQKVSGCLRTFTGARQFFAIRSYLSTAAKHGPGVFDALVMLTKGQPWMPAVG